MSSLTLMRSKTAEVSVGAQASVGATLDLLAGLLAHADLGAAAAAFVRDLARHCGYDRVALAMGQGAGLCVLAVSDGVPAVPGTPRIERLNAALAEALDQRASLVLPESRAQAHPRITLALARLIEGEGASAASVPLMAAGHAVGALCAERRGGAAISAQELETLEHLACLAGPVLHLMRLNERSLRESALARLRAHFDRLRRPQQAALRYGLIGAIAAVAGLTLLPADYHVGGHARLEGAVQRMLVAPADGFLKRVHVRPGDKVQAGQLLVELAEQDLLLEKKRWQSQLAQYESAYGAANARADRAQLVINQSRVAEAQAQLELVDMKLERGRVEAPFDGLVIQGDLSQSLGAPLQQGAELMSIAPHDQFRVIVEVDERDIGAVQVGQAGSVALSALPWDALPVRIRRITPMATVLDGRNVFEVEAELLEHSPTLRPGLQGSARIVAGRQPLWRSWSRRLVDAARLTWWEWFG
jgi:multidrug resistance efflux pump